MNDKSVISATSVFGNDLTPTNTTPIPSFVRNDEQSKDQGPGLGEICIDCQFVNIEHLLHWLQQICLFHLLWWFSKSPEHLVLWYMLFYAQLRCSGTNLAAWILMKIVYYIVVTQYILSYLANLHFLLTYCFYEIRHNDQEVVELYSTIGIVYQQLLHSSCLLCEVTCNSLQAPRTVCTTCCVSELSQSR